MTPSYLDPRSGAIFALDTPRWCAPDGAPLLLTPLPGLARSGIETGVRSLWRYAAALPFRPDAPITLGEGCTPLIERSLHLPRTLGPDRVRAHVKCEWMMPSGSFKDRGASVMLSLLRAQGVTAVLEDSSGNGGAAIACYAAAGGMQATILVPAGTSPAKIVQTRAYGAAVEWVEGTREDTAAAAIARSGDAFYASHAWHPFFLQGTKTLAYELWEDLGFRAPDNVIIPCGGGSNVLGCQIGFGELFRAGEIAEMPRLFAAQPVQCAPIARAWINAAPGDPALGDPALGDAATGPTIAEGTAIARPVRLREVLGALRETNGGAVMLEEAEIARATIELAAYGLYVEPTSAQVAAAFGRLLASGAITAEQTTVLVLTGAGLKATPRIAELLD